MSETFFFCASVWKKRWQCDISSIVFFFVATTQYFSLKIHFPCEKAWWPSVVILFLKRFYTRKICIPTAFPENTSKFGSIENELKLKAIHFLMRSSSLHCKLWVMRINYLSDLNARKRRRSCLSDNYATRCFTVPNYVQLGCKKRLC